MTTTMAIFMCLAMLGDPTIQYHFEATSPFTVTRDYEYARKLQSPKRKIVIVISKTCPVCPKENSNEIVELKRVGYRVGHKPTDHIELLEISTDQTQLTKYRINTFPTYILYENSKEVRRAVGKLKPFEITNLYYVNTDPKRSKPAHSPKPDWTWPGMTEESLKEHLSKDHNLDIEGLTFEELRELHDSDHNAGFKLTK